MGDRPQTFDAELVANLAFLRTLAWQFTRNNDAADDLAADTVAKALWKWNYYEPGTNIRGWLRVMMKNIFFSGQRKVKWVVYGDDVGADVACNRAVDPADKVLLTEIKVEIDKLSAVKKACVLVTLDGSNCEEAAADVGISVNAYKCALSRARKQLRDVVNA